MKVNGKKLLTPKQAKAAAGINKLMAEAGVPFPTADMVAAAHEAAYDIHPTKEHSAREVAGTIGAANLKKPHFLAALGLDSRRVKEFVANEIVRNIEGTNPMFPRDKDVYLDSLKMAVRVTHGERLRVSNERDEYANRSTEDLQFFVANNRWPGETEEDARRRLHGEDEPGVQ